MIAKETQTIGGLLLHIEMRPDVEDSDDAPWATVVDRLNSDEPMGLSDRQIVELLESDEPSSADESVTVRIEAPVVDFLGTSLFLS